MTNQRFHHVVLMGRPGVPGAAETLTSLFDLLNSQNITVSIEKSIANVLKSSSVSSNKLPKEADLIIVVGGDGSLLDAAHIAIQYDLPVLGVHRGRLGFLTDIPPNDLNKVIEVLSGNYREERRFLLEAQVSHQDKIIAEQNALNEVVLLPGNEAHMIEFETYVNNEFVHSQRADGMIIATPTGSTAYALSGGGPILHPSLNAIALVPMFPHTLSSRPIVVTGDSDIKILIAENNDASPYVSCDGQTRIAIPPGGKLHINRKPQQLRLIHPQDYNYYATLRSKLRWESYASRT